MSNSDDIDIVFWVDPATGSVTALLPDGSVLTDDSGHRVPTLHFAPPEPRFPDERVEKSE